jgi:ankyrin repeat protein
MDKNVFKLLKENKFEELERYILSNKNLDLDIKDDNFDYFINYAVNLNKIKFIKLALKRGAQLDILDGDGKSILHNPIKYNYHETIDLILKESKNIIGIPITDNQDKNGNTPSHYSIIFNNLPALKKLISNNANLYLKSEEGIDSILLAVQNNRINFIKYFLTLNINLETKNLAGETPLYYSIMYQFNDISYILLNAYLNLNVQENIRGLAPIHQAIKKGSFIIVKKLIDLGCDINIQDFLGRTPIHYSIEENRINIFNLLEKLDINFNLENINGYLPLHSILEIKWNGSLKNIIRKTNLNIQNNQGNTCMHLLVKKDWQKYSQILEKKEINLFIKNRNNQSVLSLTNDKNDLINLVAKSYLYSIKKNKKFLKKDWEILCSNDDTNKIFKEIKKTLNSKFDSSNEICLEKITQVIKQGKRSLPLLKDLNIKLDFGVAIDNCSYTGATIDIIFGLLFLKKKFLKNNNLGFLLKSPLSENNELESYWNEVGININYKLFFVNSCINWTYQQLYLHPKFNDIITKMLRSKVKYIIIPINIEQENSHANIIFWDVEKKLVERFEPNGKNNPLSYNPNLLDTIILNKLKMFDDKINYLRPVDYLPTIGVQILEGLEKNKCKIGDPNGFCAIWCTWWIYQKLTYQQSSSISSKDLIEKIIKKIKLDNLSFKEIIRNFSSHVTELRDSYLKKINLDINDWINENMSLEQVNKLEKIILNL